MYTMVIMYFMLNVKHKGVNQMEREEKIQACKKWLAGLDDFQLADVVGRITADGELAPLCWYDMTDFDAVMDGASPRAIADGVFFGNYSPESECFHVDAHGQIFTSSTDKVNDIFRENIDDIADFIVTMNKVYHFPYLQGVAADDAGND